MIDEVIVHIGVHKTATTYIQNTLLQNKELLRKHSIGFIPLHLMRKGITKAMISKNIQTNTILNLVYDTLGQGTFKKLILSDENLLGGVNDIYTLNKPYPRIRERLTKIRSIFQDQNIKIIINVREYSEYYASMYCEFLRHTKKFITFRKYMENFDYLGFNWKSLINDLLSVFKKNQIEVFFFEDFVEREKDIFAVFLSGFSINLKEFKKKDARKSFNHQTILMMQALNKSIPNTKVLKFMDCLDKQVIKNGDTKKFDPWNKSEKDFLKNKYQQDVVQIKNMTR